jgi:transcriptional regulator with XRE-family HTH domain
MFAEFTPNMSKAADINFEVLTSLRSKGASLETLAIRFRVSRSTIQRKLKTKVAAPEVLSFAAKLQRLVDEAPDGLCRKELLRSIHFIRTRHNVSRDGRKAQIIEAISTGAQTIEDIADDCGLDKEQMIVYKEELLEIIDELIAEKRIVRRARGGIHNRGRKQKFIYLMAD